MKQDLPLKTQWRDFEKSASADAAAVVDSRALKGDCSIVRSEDGTLQIVGRKRPVSKNALVMSEKEAINLYLDLMRKRRGISKQAGMISSDGKHFVLKKGKTPWHVASEYKKTNPGFTMSTKELSDRILAANKGVKPGRFAAGVKYVFPDLRKTTIPSQKVTHTGIKMDSRFLDLLKFMEGYGMTNSTGRIDRERIRSGLMEYLSGGSKQPNMMVMAPVKSMFPSTVL